MQKLRFMVTRDSGGFSTRLESFESLQRVTKSTRIKPSTRAQESTKENRVHPKQSTNCTRLKWIQNPEGHKEDCASIPNQSQYKTQQSMLKSLAQETRGKGEHTEREAPEKWDEGDVLVLASAQERGEGWGVFKVPTQGSKIPSTQTRH